MVVFISIEGGDGAGKSTLAGGLAAVLGGDVVLLREPGGTALGEMLRDLLLDDGPRIDPRAEALLYAAARAQLVDEVIRPALDARRLVICDRYVESSLAYQGVGRDLGRDAVGAVNGFATGGLAADLVLVLDVDVEVAHRRHAEGTDRSEGPDRLESAGGSFHRSVRQAFLDLAAAEPGRIVVIDGSQAPDAVLEQALAAVEARR